MRFLEIASISVKLNFIKSVTSDLYVLHKEDERAGNLPKVHGQVSSSSVDVQFVDSSVFPKILLKPSELETHLDEDGVPYVHVESFLKDIHPPESYTSKRITQAGDVYMLGGLIRKFVCVSDTKAKLKALEFNSVLDSHWNHGAIISDHDQYFDLMLSIFVDKMMAITPYKRPSMNIVKEVIFAYIGKDGNRAANLDFMISKWLPDDIEHKHKVMLLMLMRPGEFNCWDISGAIEFDNLIYRNLFDLMAFRDYSNLTRMFVKAYAKGDRYLSGVLFRLHEFGYKYVNTFVLKKLFEKDSPVGKNLRDVLMLGRFQDAPKYGDDIYSRVYGNFTTPKGEVVNSLILLQHFTLEKSMVSLYLLNDESLKEHLRIENFKNIKSMLYDILVKNKPMLLKIFKEDFINQKIAEIDARLVELFKQSYMKDYGMLFHNPRSTMLQKISGDEINSIEDVIRYKEGLAGDSSCYGVPNRTERVWDKLTR